MKKLLFVLVLLCIEKTLQAQRQPYVYTIYADSVKITNSCDTAELIIENHTQNVPGFLYNKGRGRTEFRRARMLSDSTIVLGGDTLTVRGTGKNFANADLTLTGDRNHNGAFRNLNMSNFSSMNLRANSRSGNAFSGITMDSLNGFGLSVYDESMLTPTDMTIANGALHYFSMDATNMGSSGNPNYVDWFMSPSAYTLSVMDYNKNAYGVMAFVDDAVAGRILEINGANSTVDIGAGGGDSTLNVQLYRGDSTVSVGKLGLKYTTEFKQTQTQFLFKNSNGANDFRLVGLPTSTSATDSVLVTDNSGQVKKRPQVATRKSATVTGSSYTVPSDIDVVFVNYTGGQATITLPTGTLDREITIKNLNTTNSVILSGLDTSESNTIATRGAITVKYTGSSWVGISKY